MKRFAVVLVVLLWGGSASAGQSRIEGVRSWTGPDHTRVVFDLSAPVNYRLFTLKNPNRVVVDIKSASMPAHLTDDLKARGVLRDVRSATRNGGDVRVVFDLASVVNPKSFAVRPNEKYGDRLVVDLETTRERVRPVKTLPQTHGELVIAIDAGHGGEDPGAIGADRTYEKAVTLAVAQKLAKLIDETPGMRPLLTRDGDYYLPLRGRTRRARAGGADIFISLHADAFRDRHVSGSSVFVLSSSGASSEMARVLAAQENRSDRIGGVSLEGKDDVVASVLVDLSRAATIESSSELADGMLDELDRLGDVHRNRVERAGFVVLKSLDMPSILVELGFITNPTEEAKLRSNSYQWQLARGLQHGVSNYVETRLPALQMASADQRYVVKRGDTLSEIARRHQVSVARLRRANDLSGDTIVAGTKLTIP